MPECCKKKNFSIFKNCGEKCQKMLQENQRCLEKIPNPRNSILIEKLPKKVIFKLKKHDSLFLIKLTFPRMPEKFYKFLKVKERFLEIKNWRKKLIVCQEKTAIKSWVSYLDLSD